MASLEFVAATEAVNQVQPTLQFKVANCWNEAGGTEFGNEQANSNTVDVAEPALDTSPPSSTNSIATLTPPSSCSDVPSSPHISPLSLHILLPPSPILPIKQCGPGEAFVIRSTPILNKIQDVSVAEVKHSSPSLPLCFEYLPSTINQLYCYTHPSFILFRCPLLFSHPPPSSHGFG